VRVFLGFLRKEMFHVLRDRRTLLVLFGLPVVLMVLFGFALRNEVEDIKTALVVARGGPLARRIVSAFAASPNFDLVATPSSAAVAERMLQDGRVHLVVVLEPDLERALGGALRKGGALSPWPRGPYQILADGSDPNTARAMVAYATGLLEGTLAGASAEAGGGRGGVRVLPVVHMAFNPTRDSAVLFVPGLMALVLTLVSALMTSVTIAREKELGTMEVLLVSPLRPLQIIVGKVVPYLGLSFLNVLIILGLARFAFDVPLRGSLTLLIGECLLFTVCALALGVLVSTNAETQQAATTASMSTLMFPTLMLSGFIFPLESMPRPLQWASFVVPGRWFLEAVRGIMLKGLGLAELWPQTLILAGMTAALLLISVRKFRIRLE
jgi:ABC-2 type transport system permease protein